MSSFVGTETVKKENAKWIRTSIQYIFST